MFKNLLPAFGQAATEGNPVPRSWSVRALRQAYDDWRFGRDIAAIMAAFDRLSNRQLDLVGFKRDRLYDAVEEMILDAERQRALGLEVTALLEAPANTEARDAFANSEPTQIEEPIRDMKAA